MFVSTAIEVLDKRFGEREAIALVKEAGFSAFDMSLFAMGRKTDDYYTDENYIERATKLRQYIDDLGIVCNQAHAPFSTENFDGDTNSWFYKRIVTSIEVAAILGAKIIVVHPVHNLNYAEHAAELFDINVEFYKSLIPYAQKFGIKIATENMWQKNNGARVPSDSVCSRAWEFCKLIDTVNSPWIVGCLDIGHVSLMGTDIPTFIKELGKERLCALHIHDTNLVEDLHTIPYLHKINYGDVLDALSEIEYSGDITFEANAIYRNFPKELHLSVARLMCDIGNHFAKTLTAKI